MGTLQAFHADLYVGGRIRRVLGCEWGCADIRASNRIERLFVIGISSPGDYRRFAKIVFGVFSGTLISRDILISTHMFNPDILNKADKVLRPVLKELASFPWLRLEGCCAGHKADDSLWIEVNVLGSTGLRRLSELLRMLDSKLTGTDCMVECLLSYSAEVEGDPVPHGWIPAAIEVSWPSRGEW